VLGDAARISRGDISAADIVKKRRLAVVDMDDNCDDRRALPRLLILIFHRGIA